MIDSRPCFVLENTAALVNICLRRYFAVLGVITVLSWVAGTHPSRIELALWAVGMALVAAVLLRWSDRPARRIPSSRARSYILDSDYLPPSKARRPWTR